MTAMPTDLEKRYQTDLTFHHAVDEAARGLELGLTPHDLHVAASMACDMHCRRVAGGAEPSPAPVLASSVEVDREHGTATLKATLASPLNAIAYGPSPMSVEIEETTDVPVNLNDFITWTPTEAGAEVWNRKAIKGIPARLLPHVLLATPGEPMRVQAWEFMAAIGPGLYMGGPLLVERNTIHIKH